MDVFGADPGQTDGGGRGPRAAVERRHVTVLFCDLVGSSKLGATLDPEDFSDLIRAYRTVAETIVARYGGIILKFVGDGILACWGYPRASEDDARRCLAAALEMTRALPPVGESQSCLRAPIAVRIAVDAGTCIVGSIGADAADVIGEAPNRAAFLQNKAPPDTVLTTLELVERARDVFVFEPAGRVLLKSGGSEIDIFRVAGLIQAWWHRAPTPDARMIGREAERAELEAYWRDARVSRAGPLVITGEAGIGKSTLLAQLRPMAAADRIAWREAACAPEAEQSPLQPIRDVLAQDVGLGDAFGEAARLTRISAYLAALGLDGSADAELLALLLDASGRSAAAIRPEVFRQSVFDMLLRLFERRARRTPMVLAVEDAHWSDPTTREFVVRLARPSLPRGLALVVSSRGGVAEFSGSVPNATTLALERLEDSGIARIIERTLDDHHIDDAMMRDLVERCDGVPFYADQIARVVRQRRLTRIEDVPAADITSPLDDLLLARLDAAGEHRDILQYASVLGRSFDAQLVASIAERDRESVARGLAALERSGLIGRAPPGAVGTHVFRHVLLREISYRTMLRAQSRELHRRAARALESSFQPLARARPDLVAAHLASAGLPLEAFEWWARAGDRSVAQGAAVEAKTAYSRALEAIANVAVPPELRVRELEVRASHSMQLVLVDGASGASLREACLELLARAADYGDPAPMHCFRAQWLLNFHHVNRGEIRQALPHAEGLLVLARRIGNPGILMQANRFAALSRLYAGQVARAIEHYEAALNLHDPVRDREHRFDFGSEPGVVIRAQLALALTCAGKDERADALDDAAVGLAREIAHPHSLVHALSFSATRLAMRGAPAAAERLAAAHAVCEANGFVYWDAWNGITQAVHAARTLAPDESLALLRAAGERYAAFGARQGLALLDVGIGSALVAAGRHGEALAHLRDALRDWRATGLRLYETDLRALAALARLGVGGERARFEAVRRCVVARCGASGAHGSARRLDALLAFPARTASPQIRFDEAPSAGSGCPRG